MNFITNILFQSWFRSTIEKKDENFQLNVCKPQEKDPDVEQMNGAVTIFNFDNLTKNTDDSEKKQEVQQNDEKLSYSCVT